MDEHERKIEQHHSLEYKIGVGVLVLGVLALGTVAYGLNKAYSSSKKSSETIGNYIPPVVFHR